MQHHCLQSTWSIMSALCVDDMLGTSGLSCIPASLNPWSCQPTCFCHHPPVHQLPARVYRVIEQVVMVE